VHQFVIGGIVEEVKQRQGQSLPAVTEAALGRACEMLTAGDPEQPTADELATAMAHAGYLARVAEGELFEPARQPIPYVEEKLREAASDSVQGADVGSGVALQLARQEPEGRPDPDDPRAGSWQVPGPGGHVRHYVALETAEWLSPPQAHEGAGAHAGPEALKRYWMYGFFLRCCEEAAGP
jgi:hypothetical protein